MHSLVSEHADGTTAQLAIHVALLPIASIRVSLGMVEGTPTHDGRKKEESCQMERQLKSRISLFGSKPGAIGNELAIGKRGRGKEGIRDSLRLSPIDSYRL